MNIRNTPLRCGIILITVLFLSGCSTLRSITSSSPSSSSGSRQTPSDVRKYRFPDLPVPNGLSLDAGKSFIFESPGTRAGHLVYSGFRNYGAVVKFYREKMLEHGWRLVSSFERGQATMVFEKPGWVSNIVVRTNPISTIVEIDIGPREKRFVEQNIPAKKRK